MLFIVLKGFFCYFLKVLVFEVIRFFGFIVVFNFLEFITRLILLMMLNKDF